MKLISKTFNGLFSMINNCRKEEAHWLLQNGGVGQDWTEMGSRPNSLINKLVIILDSCNFLLKRLGTQVQI
jgi:hypothetical protein